MNYDSAENAKLREMLETLRAENLALKKERDEARAALHSYWEGDCCDTVNDGMYKLKTWAEVKAVDCGKCGHCIARRALGEK